MTISFKDRVAVVTGAGSGLGRAYALELARRGAKLMINDFGGAVDGCGGSSSPAEAVAREIQQNGGQALYHEADVTQVDQVNDMVSMAVKAWGAVDILINNAGILRDSSFGKMNIEDFRKVLDVHAMGSVICTKSVWNIMKEAKHGRILMTTSSSGLYGNFGQSNYATAKMGLIGLMKTLQIEGLKSNIHVNAIGPGAATRMTHGVLPEVVTQLMSPESVVPAAIYLVSDDAPRGVILNATAGGFSRTYVSETEGIYLEPENLTAEKVAENFDKISDQSQQKAYSEGGQQVVKFVSKAAESQGIDLSSLT